ncbi:LysE family translocator [Deferribacteraceae bacterium V6Fe1]|nr:LysE family translocator [Deferribacteraceae bacterium V6Fe1]
MLGIYNFETFIIASILLNLTPGVDNFYILRHSAIQGKKAGFWAALGILSGILFHTFMASLGLSTLIAKSAAVYSFVKIIGSIYLIYLGFKMAFEGKIAKESAEHNLIKNIWKIFRQGFLTNALNPKVAIFFLAFLPQFVAQDSQSHILSFMVLGLTFVSTSFIWCMLLVFSSAKLSYKFRSNRKVSFYFNKLTGLVFIIFGLKLSLEK